MKGRTDKSEGEYENGMQDGNRATRSFSNHQNFGETYALKCFLSRVNFFLLW